jgi:hypothetical protein
MPNSREYLERNREHINELKRLKYSSDARKMAYAANRETILKDLRQNKVMCPICTLDFHRYYIRKHLVGRHKLEAENAENLLKNN